MAWAASTQCAGGQGWTAAGKEEEEEELEDKEDKEEKEEVDEEEDKEEEKEVGHCSTGKLSVSPAPRPKAPKVLPPTISCPPPILLPMHRPSRMLTKNTRPDIFQFSSIYEIGQLQNWKVAKWREGQVCPATGLPPSSLHFRANFALLLTALIH